MFDQFNRTNRQMSYDSVRELIDSGIKLIKTDLRDDSFNIWLEYSIKILELTTKASNPNILLNYLRLTMAFNSNTDIVAYQKLNACIQYLIDILTII